MYTIIIGYVQASTALDPVLQYVPAELQLDRLVRRMQHASQSC